MNLNFEELHILCICNSMFINQLNALIPYHTFSNMFRFKLNLPDDGLERLQHVGEHIM